MSRRSQKAQHNNPIITLILIPFLILFIPFKWIGDFIRFLAVQFTLALTESKVQISRDLHRLINFIFRKRKKQFRITLSHQVIYGNSLTSHPVYKSYRAYRRLMKRRITKLRVAIQIKIEEFIHFVHAVILRVKYFLFGAITISLMFSFYSVDTFVKNLPNPKILSSRDIAATTKIYDRTGILLYEIYAQENRTPIKLSDIPLVVKQATIAIEDKEFYLHQGISPTGILRALYHNLTSDNVEGGSTITQQLIRSAFLTPEKTLYRKLKEIILAYWTEKLYSKDTILEMYLNQVPYGGTSWGIEAASQTYFGKSVKDLTLSEAALLAGLPAAPTLYSPFGAHPDLMKERQAQVLGRMAVNGSISKDDAQTAQKEKLRLRSPHIAIAAPHFVMYVKDLLDKTYGERVVATGGLRVHTTLDLSVQEMAQKTVSNHIETLKNLLVSNGAALITIPKTGEILAMVGSADYFNMEAQGNVNVVTSLRPPGSSIKVVTYAAALQNGFTKDTLLDDTPVVYTDGYRRYSPVNYDGRYHGRIPLSIALASSYNVPAVKTLAAIGLPAMIDQARKMGITSWQDTGQFGLSLTLGGGAVTMMDMAKVYGTLANGGTRVDLTPFIKIINYKGEVLTSPVTHEVVPSVQTEAALTLSSILSDNRARTPAFGPTSALVIPGKTVAVKTGTSDNKRDNWTIGYTPDIVTAVWVGNNDNTPMHPTLTSGVTGAAPIWRDIMTNLLKDRPDKAFQAPQR